MKFFSTVIFLWSICAANAIAQISIEHTSAGAWDVALSNRGGIGRDSMQQGGTWPRGSVDINTYIHDGGFWFGCYRRSDTLHALVETSFTPKNPFLPATYTTAFTPLMTGAAFEQVYNSANYNADGTPRVAGLPGWCIRNVQGGKILENNNSGDYVRDSAARAAMPAVFIADQNLVAAFSDSANIADRYPLGLIGNTTLYAWNNDSLRNCVMVKTVVTNMSQDTFIRCYIAPVYAFGISDSTNDNCDVQLYNDTLGMFYAYSDSEPPKRLGAVAISVINPPRKVVYAGPATWTNLTDPKSDNDRYQLLASRNLAPTYPATWRGLGSCGPFTLLPGASAELVYAIIGGLDTAYSTSRDSDLKYIRTAIVKAQNYWFSFNNPADVRPAQLPEVVQLQIFPEPVTTSSAIMLPVALQQVEPASLHVIIVDALGRSMDARAFVQRSGQSILIDGRSLIPGVYQLRIQHDGQFYNSQFVITH